MAAAEFIISILKYFLLINRFDLNNNLDFIY